MAQKDSVSVTVVTYNSGRFIKRCLESVLEQKYPNLDVIVIDNASTDGTVDILEQFESTCRIHYNQENVGFAAAQNQAIAMSSAEWVLTLNPDVLLLKDFIEELVLAGTVDLKAGTICGKLLTHQRFLRFAGRAVGGFDRHLLHAHPAPSRSRQPGTGQRPLPELRVCLRRHRRRGALPPQNDRRYFRSRANFSMPISSCIAKTPTSPGVRS